MLEDAAALPPEEEEEEERTDLKGVLKVVLALAFIALVLFIAVGFLRYFMVRYYGGW